MLSAVVYRYGIPLSLPPEVLVAMRYDVGDGELAIELAGGCDTAKLVHERFTLAPADPEWWDVTTGRDRAPNKPSAKRRAQQYRMLLELDNAATVALPVTLHRPLPPGVIRTVRLLVMVGARPGGGSRSFVEFLGEWK